MEKQGQCDVLGVGQELGTQRTVPRAHDIYMGHPELVEPGVVPTFLSSTLGELN